MQHAVAGYNSVPAGLAQPVTIAEGKVANNIATVTNTYTKQVGSFSVTKVVNADSTIIDLNPDHEYSFNYVCTKDGAEVAKGELKVNGDNTVKSPVRWVHHRYGDGRRGVGTRGRQCRAGYEGEWSGNDH